jgi:hypothetical protein
MLRELTLFVGELRLSKGEKIIRDKESRHPQQPTEENASSTLLSGGQGKVWVD